MESRQNQVPYQAEEGLTSETYKPEDASVLVNDNNENLKSKGALCALALVVVLATATIAVTSHAGSQFWQGSTESKNVFTSESKLPLPYNGVYSIYKHTSSISTGSAEEVSAFFNTYIAPGTVTNFDLGCGLTTKSVAKLSPPAVFDENYAGLIAFDEGMTLSIHSFVFS